MIDIRKSLYICGQQLLSELMSPRVWAAYLLAVVNILRITLSYMDYLGNNPGQICEAFLLAFSDRTSVTLFLLSYFILICDAPFVNARSMLMIYRVKRAVWGAGMILYMAVHTVIFYGIIFLVSAAASAPFCFAGNIWSTPIYVMAKFSPASASLKGFPMLSATLITQWQPWEAVCHAFLLIFLYSMLLALLMFVLNLNVHRFVGSACALGVHAFGFFMISEMMYFDIKYSLLANCILCNHEPAYDWTLGFTYSFYGVIILALLLLFGLLIRFTDFKASIGGRS